MSRELCSVCGEDLAADRAVCNTCGSDFHLALRTDRPAKDCGDAWIDEDSQSLVFGCQRCIAPIEPGDSRAYRLHRGLSAREILRNRQKRRRRQEG